MSNKSYKEKAFTLIELLVSISLLSIIFSYSIFELSSLSHKLNQNIYLSKIKNLIELAQSKSFHTEVHKIIINNNELTLFKDNLVQKNLTIPKKYQIKFPNTKENLINFYPTGVQTPVTIELSSLFYLCNIRASLRGRIKSECSKV